MLSPVSFPLTPAWSPWPEWQRQRSYPGRGIASPDLQNPIKAGILAMVNAAKGLTRREAFVITCVANFQRLDERP